MLAYMRNILEARRRDEGASAVEYGLLIAAIAALIVVAASSLSAAAFRAFSTDTCDTIAETHLRNHRRGARRDVE